MPVTVGATKSGGTCHPIRWPQQRFLSLICIFRPAAVRPLRSLWGTGRAGLVGLSYVIDTGCVGHSEITSSSLLLPSRKVNRPPSSISTALRRSNSCSVPVSGSSKRGIQVPVLLASKEAVVGGCEQPQLTRAGKGCGGTLRLDGSQM